MECEAYFILEISGLIHSKIGKVCWFNPPFGKGISHLVEKAQKPRITVVIYYRPILILAGGLISA
ncbi:MAG: hypothetical protein ACYDG2_17165 [Ruminiclostridium sp.]